MSLYSCIFKVRQIITGPPPPDPGGGTDPGGGCTDPNGCGPPPPDDDCDGFCPVAFCTYANSENCEAGITGVVIDNTSITLDFLESQGIIASCSDGCPQEPFEYNGRFFYPADQAGLLDCCISVKYVYCDDDTQTCPGQCTGEFFENVNSLTEDDAPATATDDGGITGYRTQQACLDATNDCCTPVDDQTICELYKCVNGEVKSQKFDLDDLNSLLANNPPWQDCPSPGQGEPWNIAGDDYYADKNSLSFCKRCPRWVCVEETGKCEKVTFIQNSPTDDFCDQGYDNKAACEGDKDNACCDEYQSKGGGGGAGAPGAPEQLEDALVAAYGYINEYFDNTNPQTFTKCPNDNIIVFEPQILDSVFLGGTSPYTKEVTGDIPGSIDGNTGSLVLDFDTLANATTTQTVTITFTRTCGIPPTTASVNILLDPADFRECDSYQDCLDSIGNKCDFTGPVDPEPIASLRLVQVQREGTAAVQQIQFETYGNPNQQLLIPDATYSILDQSGWEVCEDGSFLGITEIDIVAADANGAATEIDPTTISWDFAGTLLNFNIDSITPVGSDGSRFRLGITNLPPNAFNNSSNNFYNGKVTAGNSVSTKTLDCYSYRQNGLPISPTDQFPRGIICDPNSGGGGFDNLINPGGSGNSLNAQVVSTLSQRVSTSNRKGFVSPSLSQTTKGSSIDDYLSRLSKRVSSELISDPVLSNTTYGQKSRVPFIPVSNNLYPNVFSKVIDFRIQLIREFYDSGNDDTDYSESIFSDLTLQNIHKSMSRSNKDLINSLKDVDGSPLKNRILTKIKELIVLDKISDFDIADLENMETLSEAQPVRRAGSYNYNAFKDVLDTAESSRSINPNEYVGLNKERVVRWKTIAEDLDKKLLVVENSSDVEELYVKNTDNIDIVLRDGTPSSLPITDFDTVNFVDSGGIEEELVLDTQIHRSKVFDFEETVALFKRLNEQFDIKMSVTTAANAKIEETASLEDARPDQYVLKLNPETIEDIDIKNQLLRRTGCDYTLMEEADVEEWVKNKTYPFYKFYVHHSDLFLDHLERKKEVSMEYKDISFYNFADSETEDLPVIPRRIPWYIVIVPTDRDDLITTVGISKLIDYQTRVLRFNLSPITSEYKQNFESPVMDEEYEEFYEDSSTGETFFEDFTYRYNSSKVRDTIKPYKQGSESLPRSEPATMTLFKTIREIVEGGDEFVKRNTKTISWGSVYKRMPKSVKKSISLVEVSNFTDLKFKLLSGKVSSNTTFNDELGRVKDSVNQGVSNASQYTVTTPKKLTTTDFLEETPELLE